MPMTERCFIDTNVLVYSDEPSSPEKRTVATELIAHLLETGLGAVSTQVFAEYVSITTKKLHTPIERARRKVELLGALDVVRPATSDILDAIDLHQHHAISLWDALIVRAAVSAQCTILYSEDLQNGRQFAGGVRVVNPFLPAPTPKL